MFNGKLIDTAYSAALGLLACGWMWFSKQIESAMGDISPFVRLAILVAVFIPLGLVVFIVIFNRR